MKRVMIIGQPGSGKSFLARKLGDATGLPVHHMDRIHWQPGWELRSKEEKTALCREVHAQDRWIFEGGFSASWEERLNRCDTLIWLDFPLHVRLLRVIRRTIMNYGQVREDMQDDCPEKFRLEFYQWIWSTRNTARTKMSKLYEGPAADLKIQRVKLCNRQQVNDFVQAVARQPTVQTEATKTS